MLSFIVGDNSPASLFLYTSSLSPIDEVKVNLLLMFFVTVMIAEVLPWRTSLEKHKYKELQSNQDISQHNHMYQEIQENETDTDTNKKKEDYIEEDCTKDDEVEDDELDSLNTPTKLMKPVISIEKDSLVEPSDQNLTTDYQFYLTAQLKLYFEDKKNIKNPIHTKERICQGLQCRFCAFAGIPKRERFVIFPKKIRHLKSNLQKPLRDHILNQCQYVPEKVKEELISYAEKKTSEYVMFTPSDTDAFIDNVWNRYEPFIRGVKTILTSPNLDSKRNDIHDSNMVTEETSTLSKDSLNKSIVHDLITSYSSLSTNSALKSKPNKGGGVPSKIETTIRPIEKDFIRSLESPLKTSNRKRPYTKSPRKRPYSNESVTVSLEDMSRRRKSPRNKR